MAKQSEQLTEPKVEPTKIYADVVQVPAVVWKCKCGQPVADINPDIVKAIASGGYVTGKCGKCGLELHVTLSKVKQAVARNKGTKPILIK